LKTFGKTAIATRALPVLAFRDSIPEEVEVDASTYLAQRIPGYANLDGGDHKAIQEFSLMWSAFEGTMFERRAEPSKLLAIAEELDKANALVDMAAFTPALKFWSERYFPGGEESHHWPHLHMDRTTKKINRLVVDVLTGEEWLPVHVLQALLLIVLRLRNNLFHGEKWAYGIAGQRQNFEHACAVMMATMDLVNGHG
jgi:hypothetical protein